MARLAGLLLACAALTTTAQDRPPGFRAGFAETDITPPLGTPRQGWNSRMVGESVLDPLYARAAAFEIGGERVALVVLDTALISAEDTAVLREKVRADHGLPPSRLMVAATHNHSGPAMIHEGLPRDEAYIRTMLGRAADAVGRAIASLEDAELGVGSAFEWAVAYNRRVVMRDGTVTTHGSFKDPKALAFEGPIDPEVGVLAARRRDGTLLGALVNFACHPGHHGGDPLFSAGYPGVVARVLKARGVPVTLFLQGAAGNIATSDPRGLVRHSMTEMGTLLATAAAKALDEARWTRPSRLAARATTLELPFRAVTEEDLRGTRPGTQRLGEKGYYERKIPELLEDMKRRKTASAEVQVFRLDDVALAAQPSESFVEHGLCIKQRTWPVRTFVVAYANGMVGYLPTEEAFERGGYECTFGPPSCLAPDAGRRLADAAIKLLLN